MADVPTRRSTDPRAIRTRAAVLGAAVDLFGELGFEATSVAMIGKHAGVGMSSIYGHFESKAELIDELVGVAVERWADRFAAVADADPIQAIVALGETYLAFAVAEPAAARALALVSLEPGGAGPHARAFLEGFVDRIDEQVRTAVARGRVAATQRPAVAAALLAAILGLVDQVSRRDALAISGDVAQSAMATVASWARAMLV